VVRNDIKDKYLNIKWNQSQVEILKMYLNYLMNPTQFYIKLETLKWTEILFTYIQWTDTPKLEWFRDN
jgi:hypothetical protein